MNARKHIAWIGLMLGVAAFADTRGTRAADTASPLLLGVGDIVVEFDHPRSFANMDLGAAGRPRLILTSSFLSLATNDAFCDEPGCTYSLNQLDLGFSDLVLAVRVTGTIDNPFPIPDMDFDENGTFFVQNISASISGPLNLTRVGKVIVVPQGTPVTISVFVSGGAGGESIDPRTIVNTRSLPQDLLIELDSASQIASIDGELDFTVSDSDITIPAVASVHGTTQAGFVNLPPMADAGPPQEHQCPGVVTLDASGSTDPQNDIVSYLWDAGPAGSVESPDPIADFFLDFGVHVIQLTVTDSFGAQSVDFVTVTVEDTTPPEFTFVPTDITISSCVDPDIGFASAVDNCGEPVAINNDAPSKFPLGSTTVTWTATDESGNVAEATQVVTAVLRDDPSCCPTGTNIVVGTQGPNVLTGTPGSDCILGLGGDDQINTFGGADFVSGGTGRDTIATHHGDDHVVGGDGDDIIDSGPGNDFLDGNAGIDTCSGGGGVDAVSCEIASHCTAACCATQTCAGTPPDASQCGPAFAQTSCLSYVLGTVVSRDDHNWECVNGNCSNCATFASCAPGASGCPWGVVWSDRGTCN